MASQPSLDERRKPMPSTPRLLLIVDDSFEFQDGTIHFTPGVPFAKLDSGIRVKPGDRLELRRPDGTTMTTPLNSLEFFTPSRGECGIALNKPVTKADVPAGTEIWWLGRK